MKNNENPLDAFRAEWRQFGEGLEMPVSSFTFTGAEIAERRGRRFMAAVFGVAWLLVTVAALRWIPMAGNNVVGALGDSPEVAFDKVYSMMGVA